MKSFLTLAALTAFCNSAYCLSEGTYKIGSASLPGKVLTEVNGQEDLVFDGSTGQPGQIWDFTPDESKKDYFTIQNLLGAYISCETLGSLCKAGDEPASFRPEFVGDKKYELVDGKTGYFLRLADGNKLKLAEYEDGTDQEFLLTQS